jgi:cyclopropane fatty-acyl-phospholipid synthase-like methyltransferase
MTILDVGCGRGRLMEAAAKRGAQAIGVTISEEQVRHCRARGLDVRLLDYRDIGDDWTGRFDAVIANGSIEHFVSVEEGLARRASDVYRTMFALVHRILNPSSPSRRFVTTAIHHRRRPGEPLRLRKREKVLFALLAELYGGWYPLDGQLENCARGLFRALEVGDGTRDYLWTSEDAFRGWWRRLVPMGRDQLLPAVGLWQTLAEAGPRAPLFLANPWLWTQQFRGDPPPVVLRRHTWEYESRA